MLLAEKVWASHGILLISNDSVTANSICMALSATGSHEFALEWVHQLSEGNERLHKKGIAAVLLDLDLPDSHGAETFDKLFITDPDIPTLIIGRNANEALAKQAVDRGAQDYILSDHFDTYSLPRAVRNADRTQVWRSCVVPRKRRRAVVTS